ncbi:SMI1/KNR4 family protein [Streptomyces sp. NBC_01800]|uniref:SMI1/KNR4 family protein n=1 Tax=Streptomyces sp. NBC_01800 TaxID=2975945 RepID=UPI002DD81AE1|nr:SMI1/KNR4 family protein [Streptomyces sp. NBC_01800]WSA69568.1 SMI1/KNR4 family protein [Streptomyces sp. NBC_01800]
MVAFLEDRYDHRRMWKELITQHAGEAEVEFTAPATDDALRAAVEVLGHPLPDKLVSVLRESNGIVGEYGFHLVSPLETIVQRNLELRSSFSDLCMAFDQLLFFSDMPGNGDLFGIVLVPGQFDQVFLWDHETDSRRWAASSVEEFVERWLNGVIREQLDC